MENKIDEDAEDAEAADSRLAGVAGAIAEPARARMLCCLMDGYARTATELAVVAQVGASTASAHLARLMAQRLVTVRAQGKHRYYQLADGEVAAGLEALLRIAGLAQAVFVPTTPHRLRQARTCYDHMAGTVAVALHDHLHAQDWLKADGDGPAYRLTATGAVALENLGLDLGAARQARRQFACACLDWSERRPHLGGALGAALLATVLRRGWVERDLDSRALGITREGRRQFKRQFGIDA